MAGESGVLAMPLLAVAVMLPTLFPILMAAGGGPTPLLAFGAGVYEELAFRLIGVTLGVVVLKDVLGLPAKAALWLAIGGMAMLFSLYHYRGVEAFAWDTFTFRTLAGVYFGVIFHLRGFGVAAGTHAAYDLLVIAAW
jgi:hypothetical protein